MKLTARLKAHLMFWQCTKCLYMNESNIDTSAGYVFCKDCETLQPLNSVEEYKDHFLRPGRN
jgi:hypothetical protein